MDALQADRSGIVIPCRACGQKNRLGYRTLDKTQRCGKCQTELPKPAAPVDVPGVEAFDALIAGSPLPVLVDFWAPWCGPCLRVAPEIARVAAQQAGRLVVAKVDTEAVPALGERFRIRSIPTMAMFLGGREANRQMGAMPAQGILAFIDATLGGGAAGPGTATR